MALDCQFTGIYEWISDARNRGMHDDNIPLQNAVVVAAAADDDDDDFCCQMLLLLRLS